MKPNSTNWSVIVPICLDEALETAVKKSTFKTKSDFVRDAVRRKLEALGFRPTLVFSASDENKSKEVDKNERSIDS